MLKDDIQLIEYALGILDSNTAKSTEDELGAAPEAQQALAELEAVLSDLALAESPMPPSGDLRARLLAALEPDTRFEGFIDRLSRLFDLPASHIRELLVSLDKLQESTWVESGMEGILFRHLDGGPRVAAADCGFVRVEPGCSYPAHRHLGEEWKLILTGEAQEDSGKIWVPGDLVYKSAGSTHAFRLIGDEALIFAVVLHEGFALLDGTR